MWLFPFNKPDYLLLISAHTILIPLRSFPKFKKSANGPEYCVFTPSDNIEVRY